MRPIRIAFSDFASSTRPETWAGFRHLAEIRNAQFTDFESADVLIYSDFGERHWGFKGMKIYVTGENMLPDFGQCDLAFTPLETKEDPRAIRLPYYAQVLPAMGTLVRPSHQAEAAIPRREAFCCFVASNPRGSERNRFFRKLNRRRPVDSAGRHFNNTGTRLRDKQAFLLRYRMNLAFENSRSPGYITEKLVEPLLAGCVPIYWGAPDVGRDFNPGCMINVSDFPDFESAIEHILDVDQNEAARQSILDAPAFTDNQEPACLKPAFIADPIAKLIDSCTPPGRRSYRHRRLREHTYGSPFHQTLASLGCRLDGILWKLGVR
jgi:hypothetical protein